MILSFIYNCFLLLLFHIEPSETILLVEKMIRSTNENNVKALTSLLHPEFKLTTTYSNYWETKEEYIYYTKQDDYPIPVEMKILSMEINNKDVWATIERRSEFFEYIGTSCPVFKHKHHFLKEKIIAIIIDTLPGHMEKYMQYKECKRKFYTWHLKKTSSKLVDSLIIEESRKYALENNE